MVSFISPKPWQTFPSFRDEGLFLDLEIRCQGNAIIRCHRLLLTAASPLLCKYLLSSETVDGISVISMPDIKKPVIQKLVNSLYNLCREGWDTDMNFNNELADLAHLLQLGQKHVHVNIKSDCIVKSEVDILDVKEELPLEESMEIIDDPPDDLEEFDFNNDDRTGKYGLRQAEAKPDYFDEDFEKLEEKPAKKRRKKQMDKKVKSKWTGKVWPCSECGEKFDTAWSRQKHKAAVHEPLTDPVSCRACKLETTMRYLQKHIEKKHTSYVCDICGVSSPTFTKHRFHDRYAHRMIKCNLCGKDDIMGAKMLAIHNRREHRKPGTCEYCGKICESSLILSRHILTWHTENKDMPVCLIKNRFIFRHG